MNPPTDQNHRRIRRRNGITITTVLVVVLLLTVMGSLLTSASLKSREAARFSSCTCNLKMIGLALHNYHETHQSLPPGAVSETSYGWATFLLPFKDQTPLYERIDPWRQPMRSRPEVEGTRLEHYLCPSLPNAPVTVEGLSTLKNEPFGPFARSDYRGVAGTTIGAKNGTLFVIDDEHPPITFDDITDGMANTLVVAETYQPDTWTQAGNIDTCSIWAGTNGTAFNTLGETGAGPNSRRPGAFGSSHAKRFVALDASGRVRRMNFGIDPGILRALGTRAGEDVVDEAAAPIDH